MNEPIPFSKEDPIAQIILNRPETQNALDYVGTEGLQRMLKQVGADQEVRVVFSLAKGKDPYGRLLYRIITRKMIKFSKKAEAFYGI